MCISSSAYCQTNLTVPTINATDVVLSWDDNGCSAGNYILRYRESGAAWNQNSSITIPNTQSTQTDTLSNLNISTTYNWRMKCGSSGLWVNGPDFTTSSSCNLVSSISVTDATCDNTMNGGATLII